MIANNVTNDFCKKKEHEMTLHDCNAVGRVVDSKSDIRCSNPVIGNCINY